MNAGVGPAGTGQLDWATQKGLHRATDLARNGRLARLLGKSAVARTVVAQLQDDGPIKHLGGIEFPRFPTHHGIPFQTSSTSP